MHFTNYSFLQLIILNFTFYVSSASTHLCNDTKNRQKLPVLGGQYERDNNCKQSTVATTSTGISCVPGLFKCKSLEKGQCTSLIEPCIEPLCSGFSVKIRKICVPGRCECPEERQFCTNGQSTQFIIPKKSKADIIDDNEPVRGSRKWIRAFSTFLVLVIKEWYHLILVFIIVVCDAVLRRERLLMPFLLKFLFPSIIYFATIVIIQELGVVIFLFLFTAIIVLPTVIALILINLN